MPTSISRSFSLNTLKHLLQPAYITPCLTVGIIVGIINTSLALAFASLIFSGELSGYIPQAIGIMLLADLIITAGTALFTSIPGVSAGLQDISTAVIAVTAAAIIHAMHNSATPDAMYWTVVAFLTLSAISTGAILWLLGHFKLGNLVRFIPYSVLGGFLGGTGLLLVRGGISVLSGASLDLNSMTGLFASDLLAKWGPGLVVAIVLIVLLRRSSSPLIVPGVIMGSIAAFYIGLLISGTSFSEASEHGWMLIGEQEKGTWQPWTMEGVKQIDWEVLAQQAGSLGAIAALSAISLLLNATGLELVLQRDVDLNRELQTAGVTNVMTGFIGGGVGFHALSSSILSDRLGARGLRLAGIITGLFSALVLVVGGGLLAYVPNLPLGGLILFLGLDLLIEWCYNAWFKFSRIEYAMIIIITVIMNSLGFLEGIAIGLVLAVSLFVIAYSKTPVIKQTLTGVTRHSNVVRPHLSQGLLRAKGEWLYILQLQGYLFFGTASTLLGDIQARLADSTRPSPRYIVFDFRLVTGLDSSAELSFKRIQQIAQMHKIMLIFTHLAPAIHRVLGREVLRGDECHEFPDLDRGIEWCENQTLNTLAEVGLAVRPTTLVQQLKEALGDPDLYARLLQYFERQEIAAEHTLIRQGDPPRGLYFIEEGHVTVQLEAEHSPAIRLRRMEAGTIIGEIGLYLNRRATASVITGQACTIYRLTPDALRRMEADAPEVAAVFHRFMVGLMAERLGHTTETLQTLAAS